jgi:amidase
MLADLAAKKVSARELLEAHVARNGQVAKAINAVIATDLDRARKDAAAIDDARAKGATLGAFAGLPMTIKDGYDVENMPATAGNPAFKDRAKDCADATVVRAARGAGAVIWGKTNVPFMLGDYQTFNVLHGTTNNPYDVTKVPGGSSGGAGAALASGVTPLEIGSDIGGSLRHPANYCGVTSLKTTWGSLDGRGHVPPRPDAYYECDIGVYGPMARSVDDLKLLWSMLRGTPEKPRQGVKGARVAVWDEEASWPLARDVRDGVRRAAAALETSGAHVELAKPDIEGRELIETYMSILIPIISVEYPDALLRSFEAMREADLKLVASGGEGVEAAAARLLSVPTYREYVAALVRRQALKNRLAAFFARFDAILMPIGMVPPFAHQQEPGFNERVLDVDGVAVSYRAMLNWISPASALHAPALAVQAGQTPKGLPVGVQIVGPWHGEDRLFDFGFAVEEQLGGFRRPPI